jgi:Reverse transcriptase (RNA-dependent DNA polymerase)
VQGDRLIQCDVCAKAKHVRTQFSWETKITKILSVVSSDPAEPMRTQSRSGERYVTLLIDNCSNFALIWILATKESNIVTENIVSGIEQLERESNHRVVRLLTDDRGEFNSGELEGALVGKGIVHVKSIRGSPETNGICERYNRTLLELIRCCLLQSHLPLQMWGELAKASLYVLNRPNIREGRDQTPVEMLRGRQEKHCEMHPIGCKVFFPTNTSNKLMERGKAGYMLGYTRLLNAFRVFSPEENKIESYRDLRFLDDRFDYKNHDNGVGDFGLNRNRAEHECLVTVNMGFMTPIDIRKDQNFTEWKEAMRIEMENMHKHQVFEIIKRPTNGKILRSRWVLARKNIEASIKFRARVVVNGSSQCPDVDVGETFSPTLHKDTLQLVLAISAVFGSTVHQMDVETAFLHSTIDQYTLMELPPFVYDDGERARNVAVLKKALYGLSQSRKNWNETLAEFLLSLSFVRERADPCLSTRFGKSDLIANMVAVYVDDLIISCKQEEDTISIKNSLKGRFCMKDMGGIK